MSNCRSCDAPILWAVSPKSGKRIPLDRDTVTEGVRFSIDDDGCTQLVDGDGPGHVSHFATCPNASRHRRPRR